MSQTPLIAACLRCPRISELKKKKGSEMKKKDFCKEQLADNKLQQEKQDRKKEDVGILLETLEEKIKKVSAEKDEVVSEIDTLNTELAKAAQEREEQNKAFQSGVNDQRETQKLLKGSLKVLSNYYDKASLLELGASEDLAAPMCGLILEFAPGSCLKGSKSTGRQHNWTRRSGTKRV